MKLEENHFFFTLKIKKEIIFNYLIPNLVVNFTEWKIIKAIIKKVIQSPITEPILKITKVDASHEKPTGSKELKKKN